MDTSLFENFMVLSDTLSFTKAAEKLYKSESVLSRQISKLESILECRLFVRNNKSVSLTPAGATLQKGLSQLTLEYDTLIREVRAISDGHSGVIVIGLTPGVRLHDNMFRIITHFARDFPEIHIDLRNYGMGELPQLLRDRKVDFAYSVIDEYVDNPEYSYEYIGSARNFIVLPRSHPLAGKRAEDLTLYDFRDETFLFFDGQLRAIREFAGQCADAGFELKYATVSDSSMMSLMLEMHKGIFITEETSMFRFFGDSVYIPLPVLRSLRLGIIWNKKSPKECCKTFFEYVRHVKEAGIT